MNENDEILTITPLPQLAARNSWRAEALHALPSHTLIWFTKGQGRIRVAGRRSSFSTNSVLFIPAGIPHAFDAKPGHFGQIVTIPVHEELQLPEEPILYRVRDVVLHGEFINLFEGLQKEVGREDVMGRKARACRLHAALLGLWLARQDNHLVSGLGSASEALARRYTTLVERDYAKAPSIAELADELGVTPTHLSRACRAALGYTAHDILSERVMFEARSQLAGSARPVNAIAADLGFSSPAYFTRAFQKFTGNTPSAFREAHRIA